MTCEVAVMNKLGIALAADSAVTVGKNKKIYHSAEKLFNLSDESSVAFMHAGAVEIVGVPWDVVIKTYRKNLGTRTFDYLDQYKDDFLRYLQTTTGLFTPEQQAIAVVSAVEGYFKNLLQEVWNTHGSDSRKWNEAAWELVSNRFKTDIGYWSEDTMDTTGEAFGRMVIDRYASSIEESINFLFDGVELSDEIRDFFFQIVDLMFTKKWITQPHQASLVIAGYGEKDIYPRLLQLHVGEVVCDKLRWYQDDEDVVGRDVTSSIIPIGRREVIDLFLNGIHSEYRKYFYNRFRRALEEAGKIISNNSSEPLSKDISDELENLNKSIFDCFDDEIMQEYKNPLISAVGALPLIELASMAKSLVNITSFHAQLATDDSGTVGGDIDVAVVSKGDGFVWVNKKQLVCG